jgi:hypothetical protein
MMLIAGGLRLSYTEARSTHFNSLTENGTIKPLSGPVEQTEVLGVDVIVNKVVAQLKPFMEKLVHETLQTITKDIKMHVAQYAAQTTITHSATTPPTEDLHPPYTPTNEAEEWDSIYLPHEDEPIQPLDPAPSSPPPIGSQGTSIIQTPAPPLPPSQAPAKETTLVKTVLPDTMLQHNNTMVSPAPPAPSAIDSQPLYSRDLLHHLPNHRCLSKRLPCCTLCCLKYSFIITILQSVLLPLPPPIYSQVTSLF